MFMHEKKPNIVIVESFASYKTSLTVTKYDPTPEFKKLADEGYFFKNFFTPSTCGLSFDLDGIIGLHLQVRLTRNIEVAVVGDNRDTACCIK